MNVQLNTIFDIALNNTQMNLEDIFWETRKDLLLLFVCCEQHSVCKS